MVLAELVGVAAAAAHALACACVGPAALCGAGQRWPWERAFWMHSYELVRKDE